MTRCSLSTVLGVLFWSVCLWTASHTALVNASSNGLVANSGRSRSGLQLGLLEKLLTGARTQDRQKLVDEVKTMLSEQQEQLAEEEQLMADMMNVLRGVNFTRDPAMHALATELQAALFKSQCTPLLVQHNVNGSSVWNRTWAEYKAGFGSASGDYWIGNELLHQLTTNGRYRLRFDLQAADNSVWYWAEYKSIVVASESANYPLHVAGYTSNTGYDALSYQNSMMFSTFDRDNDLYSTNCAANYGGGFWFKDCYYCNVNSKLGGNFQWYWLHTSTSTLNLKSSRMWLLC